MTRRNTKEYKNEISPVLHFRNSMIECGQEIERPAAFRIDSIGPQFSARFASRRPFFVLLPVLRDFVVRTIFYIQRLALNVARQLKGASAHRARPPRVPRHRIPPARHPA